MQNMSDDEFDEELLAFTQLGSENEVDTADSGSTGDDEEYETASDDDEEGILLEGSDEESSDSEASQ